MTPKALVTLEAIVASASPGAFIVALFIDK